MDNMKEFVIKMISDYESILKTVSLKLDEIKEFAKTNGIELVTQSVKQVDNVTQNNFRMDFEKQRQAMIEQMQKMREDAQKQAKQAMEEANRMKTQLPTMPMPSQGFPVPPPNVPSPSFNIQDVKIDDVDPK